MIRFRRVIFCALVWLAGGACAVGAAGRAPQRATDPYVGALAIDADSGRVLFADRADAPGYPASVTKVMTAYLVLDAVKEGRLALDTIVRASPTRTREDVELRKPSCIGMRAGETLTVRELLAFLMVKSANDGAIFLAEATAGSVADFVRRMNARAQALGMKDTVYYNPNGMPPWPRSAQRYNVSTCTDLARLARAVLKDHPEILDYTSLKSVKLKVPATRPRGIREWVPSLIYNHNNVLVKKDLRVVNPDGSEAVDGLKTGYIDLGGSSIVLTGTRKGRRVIVVVLGSSSAKTRDATARRLLVSALDAVAW
ncbi:MAG TPA: hypothetical protein DDY72_01105 [Verrucomicrobia bacterium]|nr:hypothetical protein [Verrucomicrobiota bacterium]